MIVGLIVGGIVGVSLGFLAGSLGVIARRRAEASDADARGEIDQLIRQAEADDQRDATRAFIAWVAELFEANRIYVPGGERDRFAADLREVSGVRP